MVDRARHDEQQIRESVDVSNQDLLDRRPQRDHAPFGTAADRPRHVQHGACFDAAREDKMRERWEIGLEAIDQLFEALDIGIVNHGLRHAGRNPLGGIGKPGAERKQIALDQDERVVDVGEPGALGTTGQRGDRKAEKGVELVDFAVRVNASIALRNARAAKERCVTGVAGARIDFHDVSVGLFII